MKNLHTLSVVVRGLPCLLITTLRSFSSSQSSMVSFCFFSSSSSFSSRVSVYKSFLAALRSTLGSCENLHFRPFSQCPCLKKRQRTVFGSTPKATFWTCTGLNNSRFSLLARSAAAFSASRFSFSAAFFFSSRFLLLAACACSCWICFLAAPPFFYIER